MGYIQEHWVQIWYDVFMQPLYKIISKGPTLPEGFVKWLHLDGPKGNAPPHTHTHKEDMRYDPQIHRRGREKEIVSFSN